MRLRTAAASGPARAFATASLPRARTPWRRVPFAVVDLETTGLDPVRSEVIAVGIVPIDAGRARPGAALYRLVRPERVPTAETIRVHGIRPADLEHAGVLDDVLDDVLDALTGRVLVAHVEAVERMFLGPALRARGLRLRGTILDTQLLGRAWLADGAGPGPRLGLDELAGLLGLPVHRAHHALGDALTTAQVFLALAAHLEARRAPLTLRRLAAVQRSVR